jgi:HEPN domain-containing protein
MRVRNRLPLLQSAEKFLKAYLTQLQIDFPKTHDIGRLPDIVSGLDAATAQRLRDADALSDFGVDIRYPDDTPDLNPDKVKQAFATALDVRATVLALLERDPDRFADPPG